MSRYAYLFLQRNASFVSKNVGQCCSKIWSFVVELFDWLRHKMYDTLVDVGAETGILAISLMVNRNLHATER